MRAFNRSLKCVGLVDAVLTAIALVLSLSACEAEPTVGAADGLREGFEAPPASARPRVWWHWMNGNVTEDGIRKDLEWMKRTGIGGVQAFDANLATPQIVEQRLVYMHPDWRAAFRFAAQTADRLGLELAIAASPGWSETGGPWVPAEDGMKKLAWTETLARGGRRFARRLDAPSPASGLYGDLAASDSDPLGTTFISPRLYKDIAVFAYPVGKEAAPARPASITVAGKPLDIAALTDDSLNTGVAGLPIGSATAPTTILIDYDHPQTIRSATMYFPNFVATILGQAAIEPRLEASDDGIQWRAIADVTLGSVATTVSFPPVTAAKFRLVLIPAASAPYVPVTPAAGADLRGLLKLVAPQTSIRLNELKLSSEARIDRFEDKAGFSVAPDYYALDAKTDGARDGVDPASVVDLTGQMRGDGTLNWTPPAGDWRIVRMGWSLTGTVNHPATTEATGLEVDKMDAAAVRRYLQTYLSTYRDTTGPDLFGKAGVRAMVNDSTEVGPFNWTPGMPAQFKRLRGYDLTPFLPALTGALIGSREQSDRFLYDYRRTIADLHVSQHYAVVAAVAHDYGLTTYGEALEAGRPSLGDDMAMRRFTDVPMAAQWTYARTGTPGTGSRGDMKGASSVAHLYAQNIAAAESMTSIASPWAFAPNDLRRIVDYEFANGINRPVIHTSVHVPVDDRKPGLSLLIFGQYFNRNETWAEMARPWIDYLARNAYLLQQGSNVADIAYFYGEEQPLTALTRPSFPADAPVENAFDFVDADTLTNALTVKDGELVSPGGARYRVLYLGGSSVRMTLPVLRRVAALAEAGATVVGLAPTGSPSLADEHETAVYQSLVDRLWSGQQVTPVGQGRVIAGRDIVDALRQIGTSPDFTYVKPKPDSDILFVHRRLADGETYFLVNRLNRREAFDARFRVSGRQPELWHADTGKVQPVSFRMEGNETVVSLDLAPEESVFVVFHRRTTTKALTLPAPHDQILAKIDSSWRVSFEPGRGAPVSIALPTLSPLEQNSNSGVKYFSGVATYTTTFDAPIHRPAGSPMLLDLGAVGDVAEVRVNGRSVGTVWHAPYRIDIGAALQPHRNRLEVRVANLWVNRLIGDAQPGATKITYTSTPTYLPSAPLRPSGLLGPVTLVTIMP